MIVIDASALLELLLQTALAERVMDRALGDADTLHAPHLLDIEVTRALRRLVQREEITPIRAEQVLEDLSQMFIEWHADQPPVARIWQLARAHGHEARIELIADE